MDNTTCGQSNHESKAEVGHRLVLELRLDSDLFQQYFRLSRELFDELLARVGPSISKLDTRFRRAIGPAQRLAICLRYLATGDSFRTIAFSYRVGHCTVCRVVREVAAAIWQVLVSEFLPAPSREDWLSVAEGFRERWNFPNCVGSIDGKHVIIQAPDNSGSLYFNYKGTYSIILLAVVDSNYLFRVVDAGGYGRTSDGGTLYNSTFGEGLRDGTLDLPEDATIRGAEQRGRMPFVFVGDEAFPLRWNLMRPFPGPYVPGEKRIFNSRLSRARLVVECAFGILSSQWRMYRRVIGASPATAEVCVRATCVLHNYLRVMTLRRKETSPPRGVQDGSKQRHTGGTESESSVCLLLQSRRGCPLAAPAMTSLHNCGTPQTVLLRATHSSFKGKNSSVAQA
ncbi:hypothetical protein ACEWY4_010344 [Coilia grayii]|uniref:DDE Tnp4 domain-containing protein n=1 Tax=Coilia grayii TaxID=363190 RepID=A0ABD1K1N2_9TELE